MQTLPDRYTPLGTGASGGMSSVVFCQDTILERPVAVKYLQPAAPARRMDDELAALLKMRSKHVVQVYDYLKFHDGRIGIVQEFIDGKDLTENFAPPTSIDTYYKQLWQIASGITDIHTANVIHRDIKPNNMKRDPENVIKLFDFGLARTAGPSAATMGFVGTPGFGAPELYAAKSQFTKAVDTYAFGATSLFLATGGLSPELVQMPPAPSGGNYFGSILLPIANEVIDLLNKCLSKNPVDRPDMVDIRDSLARHLNFDKHQALVVFNNKPSYLNAGNRVIALKLADIGKVEISYDGLMFHVTDVSGEVFINNRAITVGHSLPGCCVVSLGSQARRTNQRAFITFDLSHPEIVI